MVRPSGFGSRRGRGGRCSDEDRSGFVREEEHGAPVGIRTQGLQIRSLIERPSDDSTPTRVVSRSHSQQTWLESI
jgi:hypothetical protein